jgi:tripartite-type tricarboxylate transporter receptor subunit TctC
MRATFKQTVIVENRTGASAMIAANAVAKAPPDGGKQLVRHVRDRRHAAGDCRPAQPHTALKDPAIADKLIVQGIVPRLMTAGQYASFVASEREKFGKIVVQAKITLAK